jgi:PAS domain S-box-containing protein
MNERHHILIIDDDPTYREILSVALESQEYIVSAAASSSAALNEINKKDYSVALIDRILKDASGLDLLKEIKALSPNTECIIITGHASRDTALEAVQMGAYSYLQKPIDRNELQLTIQRAIEKRETERSVKDSEQFAHAVIDGLTAHIAILDQDGIIQSVNQAWRNFAEANHPVKSNVAEGANYLEVCDRAIEESSEGAVEFGQAIRDVLAGKQEIATFEYPCHSPNEKRWFIARVSPLPGDGPPAAVVAHEDITERKITGQLQKAVYKIAQSAGQAQDLDTLYKAIHEIIGRVMPAENFFIALYDDKKDLISYPYYVDEVDDPPPPEILEKSLTNYILRTGEPLLCTEEVQKELERLGEAEVVGTPSPIWVGVPLLIERKAIGAMAVQHYSDPNAYTQRELHMLEFVSSQVAHAIEHKRSIEALRKSEAFARAVIEHSPIGVSVRDRFGRLLSHNQAWRDIFAISDEDLHADLTTELNELEFKATDDYLIPHHEEVRKIFERGGFLHLPELKNTIDIPGAAAWVSQYFYAIQDNQGEVDRVVILTQDITEMKKSEKALRESEEKFRTLFDTSPLSIVLSDLEGYIRECNQQFVRMHETKGNPEDQIGRSVSEFFPEEQWPSVLKNIQGAGQGLSTIGPLERIMLKEDGTRFFAETISAVLKDNQGNPIGLLANAQDISQRKQAAEELRESEEKYRKLFINSITGIYLSFDGTLALCNQAYARIFGYEDPEEIIGRQAKELVSPEYHELVTSEVEARMTGKKETSNYVFKGIKKDGTIIDIEIFGTIIEIDGKRATYGALIDITERIKAEEEVRKLNQELESRVLERTAELEASNEELEAFSYSVSHDLRAPLRAIKGFSTILKENYAKSLDEEGVKYLELVRASSLKMDRLINDLLALSRLGRLDLSPTSINLTYIAKRVFADLAKEEPSREFDFKITPSPIIFADTHLMEVMLTNLLSNAIKFTRGKNPARIEFGHPWALI